MRFADMLARLRVACATGCLPADVGRWALGALAELAPASERLALRNELLRQAGELIGGSAWRRAQALRSEILAMRRRRDVAGAVRELVAEALALAPDTPTSTRQLLRIIGGAGSDMEGGCDVTSGPGRLEP